MSSDGTVLPTKGETKMDDALTKMIDDFADSHVDAILRAVKEDDNLGFCIDCGEQADCVEPDACSCTCESCGQPYVFGIEELLLHLA